MSKESRRHRRFPYAGPVLISWPDREEERFARGKCLDIAEGGLRLEMPVPIKVGTQIVLRAERIRISGSARVRHLAQYGSKYLIGVELSQEMKSAALEVELVRHHALV